MSAPFDKFPSLRTYIEWAVKEADCTCNEGVNGTKPIYRITAPSGDFVIIGALPDGEGLAPSMVSYLDRRLGVSSPFPHAPETYC